MAGKQGPGPDRKPMKPPMNGPERPPGTTVPERRAMKDGRGDGGVPGRVGMMPEVPMGDFDIMNPTPTEGYVRPGKRGR